MTNGITGAIPGRVWSGIGVAIGLLIVVIAGAALFRLLRDIDLDEVVAALRAKSMREVVVASGFVLAGYVTLTLYDFFALRTIGRNAVPYRIAALAGFTSYAIGHNLGATVFTGGAIRFRIYSAWGLSIIDVAKIAFVTGLTFWLGNAFLLGFGMSYAPAAASARAVSLPMPVLAPVTSTVRPVRSTPSSTSVVVVVGAMAVPLK